MITGKMDAIDKITRLQIRLYAMIENSDDQKLKKVLRFIIDELNEIKTLVRAIKEIPLPRDIERAYYRQFAEKYDSQMAKMKVTEDGGSE